MAKNIVICADGTGNRGGIGYGTNVWRLFQALDLETTSPRQIGIYHDGVGTEDNKILRTLGGALGVGIGRNIRDLYSSLVHNYEPGDRIYLFGFSRGAYTIRLLVGLISRCGIIRPEAYNNDAGALEALVAQAYDQLQNAHRAPNHAGTSAFRAAYAHCHDPAIDYGVDLEPDSDGNYRIPPIKFVGVWDTVAAVGLPFAELVDALDEVIPVKFHDRSLGSNVQFAYHALAIDDERHTFHPTLWTEPASSARQTVEQVWFPGVHSNVGGGYPKPGLSSITLDWMFDKLQAVGPTPEQLQFLPGETEQVKKRADIGGKMYDSRAGLASYYRYKPRDIVKICEEHNTPVRIHSSATERVESGSQSYAPARLLRAIGLADSALLDKVDRVIGFERALHLGFVLASIFVLISTNSLAAITAVDCIRESCTLGALAPVVYWFVPDALTNHLAALDARPLWMVGIIGIFVALLLARSWSKTYRASLAKQGWLAYRTATSTPPSPQTQQSARAPNAKRPLEIPQLILAWVLIIAVTAGVGYLIGTVIRARPLWLQYFVPPLLIGVVLWAAVNWRVNQKRLARAKPDKAAPAIGWTFRPIHVVRILCVVIAVGAYTWTVNKQAPTAWVDWSCATPTNQEIRLGKIGSSRTVTLDIRNPCKSTLIAVRPDETYTASVAAVLPPETDQPADSSKDSTHASRSEEKKNGQHEKCGTNQHPWCDHTIPAGIDGVAKEHETFALLLARPFTRHWDKPYLTPMIAVDPPWVGAKDENKPLRISGDASQPTSLPVHRSGHLYLYVNDAVCLVCFFGGIDFFYANNKGSAEVTITRVK